MKNASKKIKSLFIGAIVLIALLLITVIAQIITIYKKIVNKNYYKKTEQIFEKSIDNFKNRV